MVCEPARQSWTVLNWAVQDLSPDSWSCTGFSPRWKNLRRIWRCFDWRKRPMMPFSALSVFKLLHIWPFTAWTFYAAKRRKWLPKWLRLLWVLVLQPGVSPHAADNWAGQAIYHLQMSIKSCWKHGCVPFDGDDSSALYFWCTSSVLIFIVGWFLIWMYKFRDFTN